MTDTKLEIKPAFVTFYELAMALQTLHLWDRGALQDLNDIWRSGAPSPQSIIRNPKGYDERKQQPGNYEARLLLPTPLAEWIVDRSVKIGMPLTLRQAANMIEGKADYGLDQV